MCWWDVVIWEKEEADKGVGDCEYGVQGCLVCFSVEYESSVGYSNIFRVLIVLKT